MIAFLCLVIAVHDGDTFTCADRTKIRVAGINAREMTGDQCPRNRPCPPMPPRQSQQVVSSLILGRSLRCDPLGTSYKRIVARCTLPDGRDLSCTTIAVGAAARWDSYWRRYHMEPCRGRS